eukprot:UC4_evm9s135
MAQSSSDEGGDLSIMCWGDTCTRWDLITRLFTLCDHFSTSAYKGIPGMQEIWSTGAVFISQSLDIARPEILSGTRALQFQPAITKVGKSSWAFKTDILDVDAGLIVARQGAVMCHVDGSSSKSKQLPQGVKLDLQAKIVPDSAPLCTLSVIEPEDSSEVILGRSEVRISDCDKLGHDKRGRETLLLVVFGETRTTAIYILSLQKPALFLKLFAVPLFFRHPVPPYDVS